MAMKVVIVDSGVNLSHKVFEKSISNIKSFQYESETIMCINQDNDLFDHGTAIKINNIGVLLITYMKELTIPAKNPFIMRKRNICNC